MSLLIEALVAAFNATFISLFERRFVILETITGEPLFILFLHMCNKGMSIVHREARRRSRSRETHHRCTLIDGRVWLWLTLNLLRFRLNGFHERVDIGSKGSFLRVASGC